MDEIKEVQSIKDIFNKFKSLGAQHLLEDENLFSRRIDELLEETNEKLQLLNILNEKIAELEEEMTEKEAIDLLDVEIIRTNTQIKKAGKHIKKLESLNTSRVKVDATDRDKIRYRKLVTNLAIIKRLLDFSLNNDGKAVIADGEGSFKVLQLNKNNSNDANAEVLWNSMKQSSPYVKEWAALFNNN